MNYFKTSIPNTKLLLSNGQYVKWDKIDDQNGVTATADPNMIREYNSAIDRQVGGVEEIDKPEYDELKKKQLEVPLRPNWREEFGPGALHQAAHRRQNQDAVAAERPNMETVSIPAVNRNKAPQQIDRPKSIKR